MRELADAKKKYNAVSAQYGALEEFCKLVKKQLKVRIANWRQIRRLTARLIQNSFTSFLSQKNYTGNLNFNNKDETLDITVSLEKLRDKSSSHAQTVNSLSGGERSFSTVSLLMALWGTMETPFTAMDEFDVFMDQISRMKSTQMLLSFARGCSTRQQFIFITPQSLQYVFHTHSPSEHSELITCFLQDRGACSGSAHCSNASPSTLIKILMMSQLHTCMRNFNIEYRK